MMEQCYLVILEQCGSHHKESSAELTWHYYIILISYKLILDIPKV